MKKAVTLFFRKKNSLLIGLFSIFFLASHAQTNYYVSPAGNNANDGKSPAMAKLTIQNAVSIANNGDIINVANGNYSLTATLNLDHELSIIGESEAGVIINATGTPSFGWAINPNKSNTSLSNLTIIPNGTNGGFPIHVGDNTSNPLLVISNVNLSHITINGAKKTAFDFNAVNNLTLSYLTAKNSAKGNGIQISGCWNVNASHITTSSNAWGGLAVYVSRAYPSGVGRGSNNVTIDATTSSFAETIGVYSQDEAGFINSNITVNGLNYTVQNSISRAGYAFYFPDRSTALAVAAALPSPAGSVVKQISTSQYIVTSGLKIQPAIDAAVSGDVIIVYPGNYIESAPSSTLYNGASYVFGLFISAAKSGISIVGVDGAGIPITSYANVVANVQANATNNFGPSGVFVEGDNVTITGLNIYLDPGGAQNKTVEVIGENFTMKYCRLTDGNSLYINDWRYNTTTDVSRITKYWIEGNKFEAGTSLDISSGAGKSGIPADRKILNNYFDAAGGYRAVVSFNGSGTGVPWFTYSVGGAVITGNSFVNGEQYIRHRGAVDNSQFNWKQYWNSNSFDKAVITLSDEVAFMPRAYSYTGSYGTFTNVKRIGAIIQADISNVSQTGDLVKVGAGTYGENITVNKEVEIRGQGQAVTKIIPKVSNPNCGGSGGGSLCTGASNVFLVQANNVTIDQLTIDGDNPALTSGKVVGGADIDARNGIITNHLTGLYTNLNVNHVTIQNIFLRGIYASSGGSFSFSENTVSNVQADPASIAMFNFGGSGFFTNNKVSNANDAISSNWSKGTVYSGNMVTNSGSGIHTDNNGGQGGVADLIEKNFVSNSAANGYGIWVFAPYQPVVVKDNTVSNVDVGLAAAGQQSPVTPVFSGNMVDGQSKAGSTGVYVTTDLFGFGTSNVSASFQNNFIRNNTDGFYLESESGRNLILDAHNNSITGNTNTNVLQGVGVSGAGSFNANMKCNWWGTAFVPGIAAKINGAAVEFIPFLSNGSDNDLNAPGFQPTDGICVSAISNAQVTAITNVLCYGSSNGSATISFINGFAPFTYSLDNGSAVTIAGSPFTIKGLAAGSHMVMITDGGGNTTAPLNFTITQPTSLYASSSATDIICHGASAITVSASGGTLPYSGIGSFNVTAGTYIYTVTDINGCTATTSITPVVKIIQLPTPGITVSNTDAFCNKITLTASSTVTGAIYSWASSGSNLLVNSPQISLGQANPDGKYSVTVTENTNGCTSLPAEYDFQKQNLVSSYTILGYKEIELGENNTVATGSVGVMSLKGITTFHKNSSVASPGSFVKAKYIDKDGNNINISNPVYHAATGITLPVMLYNTAHINNLPSASVNQNVTTTLSGNYKYLTLKKGSNTTLTGTTFGTIKIEQGAKVKFMATTINIDKLSVDKGPKNGYSYVLFAGNTNVLVSNSVSISGHVYLNPDNYKVTFYVSDKRNEDEIFNVKGGNTKIIANIYIPNGKLKVTGGHIYGDGDNDSDDHNDDKYSGKDNEYVYMTGLFIVEEVEGEGRNVIWNNFDCSTGPVHVNTSISTTQAVSEEKTTTEEELKVTVLPNPSTTYFTLRLQSKYEVPVNMRVMDASGRIIDTRSKIGSNSTIQVGQNYSSGMYYAEMIQGTRRKVVQLIKGKG